MQQTGSTPKDVLASLGRDDKWYLGGGNRLVWTPTFPAWLDHPGFWDEAHYYNFPLPRPFAVALLGADGREIPCRFEERHWQPDRLRQTYTTAGGLHVAEHKSLLPNDVLASDLSLENRTDEPLTVHVVVWTMQPAEDDGDNSYVSGATHTGDHLYFNYHLRYREQPAYPVACALGLSGRPTSYAVGRSQGRPLPPRWAYTPFYDQFAENGLTNGIQTEGLPGPGLLYFALHRQLQIPPRGIETVTLGFGAAQTHIDVRANLSVALSEPAASPRSETAWNDYFGRLPSFQCSDPYLERYYWHRWYGLRLFTLQGGEDNYPAPAVCEGPAYFRAPISYSAQCHMLETRWMDTPALAQGSLRNFIHNQQSDGRYVGYLNPRSLPLDFFYHANWAHAEAVHLVHPDDAFLADAYRSLAAYVHYFDRERDPERSGLYDVQNHYETGQEYMHRYVAVDEHADRDNRGEVFRLKGVDAAVYLYEIKRMLGRTAAYFGDEEVARQWHAAADHTGQAILTHLWDPVAGLFSDLNPHTGERTGVKAATCFYPYFTDLVDRTHLSGLKRHLLDPAAFWTPYPVPSSSRDDPYFDAEARWKGERMNCPWNGRVWPMTNSHVAEALAHAALRFRDVRLRRTTAEFITRFIRMMFFDGDVRRPNSFEHYNPLTGMPSIYRGIDDYQHSWVVDLILKYVCGIRPAAGHVTIDPFPFDVDTFTLDGVRVRGHHLRVERHGRWFTTWVDGHRWGEQLIGAPIVVDI